MIKKQAFDPSTKRVFAHRGMSQLAPENTLAAFHKVKESGVHWLETDLDLTADGQIVILHDESIDRTTDKKGAIHELTLAEVETADAGSWFGSEFTGQRIPTLPQLIDLINADGLNVNFELKPYLGRDERATTLIEGFAKELKRVSPQSQVIVSSFNATMLKQFKALSPDTPTAMLFKRTQSKQDWAAIATDTGSKIIHPDVRGLTRARVEKLKKAGFELNVWTVNSLKAAYHLFDWGVDGVFTDISHRFPEAYKRQ
ncbi:glycerophosphodiester phosphodiesterase family protein [Secundilactobacillus paracollinoides]|nr:glycerophosphodiester phosphodiesterase family protein [Secundilactobacillus paracollinoides]